MELILQALPIILLFCLGVLSFSRYQASRRSQLQGVIWLQAMRTLLTHVQKHRGLSTGVIGGEYGLQPLLSAVQVQVSHDFKQIASVGEWVSENQHWQEITQHWARLAGNVQSLGMNNNIDQHTRLIKNILVFVDEISVTHHLDNDSLFRENIWRDLLTLAEYIGQVRAVGTAMSARGRASDAICLARSSRDLHELEQLILSALAEPRCKVGLEQSLIQKILNFMEYMDSRVLDSGLDEPAEEYYHRATEVLDDLYGRFDEELEKVYKRLASRIKPT